MSLVNVILLFCVIAGARGYIYSKYAVCDKMYTTVYSSGSFSQLVVVSQHGSSYYRERNCTLEISSYDGFLDGYIVSFRTIDIPKTGLLCTDYVKVSNSYYSDTQCGRSKLLNEESEFYSKSYSTKSIYVTWHTDGRVFDPPVNAYGFEMTVTGYRSGLFSCGAGMFRCDNGKCIDENWRCNGRNNCGDLSDERRCTSSRIGTIVGAVCGVVIFICIVSAAFLFFRRRRRPVLTTTVVGPPTLVQPSYQPPYVPTQPPVGPYQQPTGAAYPQAGQNPVYPPTNFPTGFENKTYNPPPPPYTAQS